MPTEIVDPPSRELEVYRPEPVGLARAPEPAEMIALASRMASALAAIVEKQHLYASISGKKFPTVEAWATIARMDNVVARESERPTRWEDGTWEATVELIRLSDPGSVIGRASAICGSADDKPWNSRGENQRRSMAVTRATSRAFRQHYSWIMALAGYEPTPAEEMRDDEPAHNAPHAPVHAKVVSVPTAAAGAAPDGLQGIVEKAPDGIRLVRVARYAGTEHPKLELVMKVEGRRHTVMLLDDAAHRAEALALHEGEVVRIIGGNVEEVVWQEGKPTKKEIWGAVDVAVLRGEEWVLASASAPALFEEPRPQPAAKPKFRTGADDAAAVLSVRLLKPIEFREVPDKGLVAVMEAVDPDTGELVRAFLADNPPGEVVSQVGTPAEPAFGEGTVVTMLGTWQKGYLKVTDVGTHSGL